MHIGAVSLVGFTGEAVGQPPRSLGNVVRRHLDSGLAAIPKSAHADRIAENFDAFDFRLDAEDMAAMAALDDPNGRMGDDPLTF